MRLERFGGAVREKRDHVRAFERGEQDARVQLDDVQRGVKVPARAVRRERVQIVPVRFIPAAVAVAVSGLRGGRERDEGVLGALFHHVVEAVGAAVWQALDKGVLPGQRSKQRFGAVVFRDELRHLHGEFVGKAHNGQKFALRLRQRVDHRGGEHRVDVRPAVGQRAALGECAQVQVDGGEPALARVEQRVDLLVGKLGAAAAGIDRELGVVEPQLLGADAAEPPAETDHGLAGEKAVAARDEQVHVFRKPCRERAEKACRAGVGEQVKIVDEEIARDLARERVAEIVGQKARVRRVGGAGVVLQKREPRVRKGVLHAFPEDREIVGIHADADDARAPGALLLAEVPVHRRRFAVAHRGDDGRERTAGNGAQAFLQAL